MSQPQPAAPLDLDAIQESLPQAAGYGPPWHVNLVNGQWLIHYDPTDPEDSTVATVPDFRLAAFFAGSITNVLDLLDRVRELEAETARLRTAWHSAKARASTANEHLDLAEHGRDCAVEAVEQLQATLNQMPRCQAPHPTVAEARCELIIQHPGWHAAHVGAWPHASWPYHPQT
ncbi:hypothetical protein [Kitasatospora sp. NPDC056531]|uniref:hypothetical protein n=1 Tax=Kitasatospora sp. NPDC056531 TaxID=3345856 RepID=UPI0036CA49DE